MIFGNFGGPGAQSGGPGPIFKISGTIVILGGALARNGDIHLDSKMQAVTQFFGVVFFIVFNALFSCFFMILSVLRLHFGYHFD